MLTEGVDVPKTQTVFLTRPTVSKILLTQMIGRALRGEKAGGTKKAYIVSFIDNGLDKIAWSNPDSIFEGNNDFIDSKTEYEKRDIRLIAISKIEEFAKMLNDSVDTSSLESVPFTQRIPVGMYAFNIMDSSYHIMVYNSTQKAYEDMMESLPALFNEYRKDDEDLSDELFSEMAEQCRSTFFLGEMIPPYDERDVLNILKYYDEYGDKPQLYSFDYIDKNRIDAGVIAGYIVDQDMSIRNKVAYINKIWDEGDENILRLFYGRFRYFNDQIEREIQRIFYPENFVEESNVTYGKRQLENMTLYEIRKASPDYEKELRDNVFEKAKDKSGKYKCAVCGRKFKDRIMLQVDHIIPMNRGGKTKPDNLQILCRKCNGEKGDK